MKKVFIILGLLLMISCSGNSTYFDLEKKGIISCHGSLISKVMIKGVEGNFDYYRFSLKETRNGIGVKVFTFDKINNAFIISINTGKTINNSDFKLKPSSKYKISHISKGDAADSEVIITTDENGNIVDASKLYCD